MKKYVTLLSLFAPALLVSLSACAKDEPKVVESVDVARYAGVWYEIASANKPANQNDCVCARAQYTLLEDNTVRVNNSCRKNTVSGESDSVEGLAEPTSDPAKFKVSFGSFRFPFPNYWIVDLADDYSYAVVSTGLRTPIWILSRTPIMEPQVYEGIVARLKQGGFATENLTPTLQQGCDYPPLVP
jgi:apolipoprotein D and lipocalin family protein